MDLSPQSQNNQAFLTGGGQMGELIRSIEWSASSLGTPDKWPTALKHATSIMLTTNFPMLICWGADFIQLYNEAFRPINGITKQPQAMGASAMYTYKEIWENIGPMFKKVMEGETIDFPDFMVQLDRDGSLENCYFDCSYSPIKEENGAVGGILVICMETTGKIKAIEELNNSQRNINEIVNQSEEKSAKLAAIIESSNDAIISKTLESIITSWNASAQRIFGYTAEEIIGKTIYKLIPPDRQEEEPNILKRLKSGERVEHFETKRLTKDGRLIDVSITISPVKDNNGNIIGLSKIARDITQQKLEEQRKNDFVAMVSHELKTPLTTISSYVQLLLAKAKKEDDEFGINALTRTEVQTKKMTAMIHDFLSLARLDEGKIPLNKTVFELHTLVEEIVADIQILNPKHQISIIDCEHIFINADRDKIGQVLNNLLTNAIKYSPNDGKIIVGCEKQNGKLKVYVKDHGVGISEKEQTKLFQRFYRSTDEKIKMIAGFGIGLYLVSEILRFHGSKIELESEVGVGSTFYFTLERELENPKIEK